MSVQIHPIVGCGLPCLTSCWCWGWTGGCRRWCSRGLVVDVFQEVAVEGVQVWGDLDVVTQEVLEVSSVTRMVLNVGTRRRSTPQSKPGCHPQGRGTSRRRSAGVPRTPGSCNRAPLPMQWPGVKEARSSRSALLRWDRMSTRPVARSQPWLGVERTKGPLCLGPWWQQWINSWHVTTEGIAESPRRCTEMFEGFPPVVFLDVPKSSQHFPHRYPWCWAPWEVPSVLSKAGNCQQGPFFTTCLRAHENWNSARKQPAADLFESERNFKDPRLVIGRWRMTCLLTSKSFGAFLAGG